MLFTSLLVLTAGYALLYAGIKGNKAKIGGTPLWQAPWLPFVAAISGGSGLGGSSQQGSAGSSSGGGDPGAAIELSSAQSTPTIAQLVTDLRKGVGYLRTGIIRAVRGA